MFTYNSDDLSTDLNKVRRLINDVNSTSAQFQDEEISFFIDTESNIYGAASIACEALAAKYGGQVDKAVGDLKISLGQKYDHYRGLADKYNIRAKQKGAVQLYGGGISKADKLTQESDTDRVEPAFYKDMFDYETDIST